MTFINPSMVLNYYLYCIRQSGDSISIQHLSKFVEKNPSHLSM
jgi:hypothetical protein